MLFGRSAAFLLPFFSHFGSSHFGSRGSRQPLLVRGLSGFCLRVLFCGSRCFPVFCFVILLRSRGVCVLSYLPPETTIESDLSVSHTLICRTVQNPRERPHVCPECNDSFEKSAAARCPPNSQAQCYRHLGAPGSEVTVTCCPTKHSNVITGAVRASREWNVTSNELSVFNIYRDRRATYLHHQQSWKRGYWPENNLRKR